MPHRVHGGTSVDLWIHPGVAFTQNLSRFMSDEDPPFPFLFTPRRDRPNSTDRAAELDEAIVTPAAGVADEAIPQAE